MRNVRGERFLRFLYKKGCEIVGVCFLKELIERPLTDRPSLEQQMQASHSLK